MTTLLKEALTKVETLSYEVQDAIAARLIADFEDELAWQDRFAATTDEQWDKLADMVRQDIEKPNGEALIDAIIVDIININNTTAGNAIF